VDAEKPVDYQLRCFPFGQLVATLSMVNRRDGQLGVKQRSSKVDVGGYGLGWFIVVALLLVCAAVFYPGSKFRDY
jgi:hypothetical protein